MELIVKILVHIVPIWIVKGRQAGAFGAWLLKRQGALFLTVRGARRYESASLQRLHAALERDRRGSAKHLVAISNAHVVTNLFYACLIRTKADLLQDLTKRCGQSRFDNAAGYYQSEHHSSVKKACAGIAFGITCCGHSSSLTKIGYQESVAETFFYFDCQAASVMEEIVWQSRRTDTVGIEISIERRTSDP